MNANPLSRNVRKFGKQVLRHLTGPVLRVTAAVVMVASSLPLSVLLPPVPAGALVTPALAATAVTPGNVVVNPTTAGAIAAYTVNFTTSGALTTSDTITLTFPAGTLLPNTAGLSGAATNATVNGANAAASGVVNGQAITLTAPAAIGNSIAVAVVFTAAAGIINPTSAGSKTIGIATSQDTTQVASNSYTITPGPSVTPGSVVVNPAQAGLIGAYTINFTTSATGALALGNAITLTFPAGTLLPNTAGLSGAATNATINGANAADSGSVSGQSITLNAPAAIGNSTAVAVVFTTNAGIINPTSAGGYTINVSTFKDITPVASNSYTITPGTAVTPGNVTVSPNTTGVIGVYTVNFTTSATGALTGGNYIKLTFPAGTLLPNTPGLSSDPTHATVNGANVATSATVSGQTITLLAPGAIGNSTAVTVVFTTAAGIINPSAGSYTVSILTFKDLAPTASNSYTIQARPSVAVNPTTAGAAAAYTVNFTTSPTGALTATSDTITLTFPANTGLPTQGALSGDPANATINGVNAAASAVISGQSITLTVPAAIANSGSVTVVFPASAGIHNPSAGSKTLTVVTTKDTAAVQSDPYTITAVATSVSGVTAAPNPTTAGAAAAYTINFTTSATGGLAAGDTISLTFPAGTGLPGQAALQGAPATVTINGGNAGGTATVAGQVITLTAPSAIANSGSVTISFTLAAGLHNPATAGNYAVLVATSKDTTGVASPAYAIVAAATAVTGGTVVLSPNRAGNAADHVISFTTSASGGLTGGADSVTITFPAGTTVPASIPAQNVRFDGDGTCNVIGNHAFTDGTVLGGVTVSGQQISFTVPTGETVPASGGACVGILGAGGILNPTTSGTYLLTMSTSKDTDTANSQAYAVLQAAGCGTTVGGVINADTTWTVAGSPFCVTSSITVNNGKTLTIEPGTEVQMGGSTLLAVDGALIARGTSALPIKFTSSAISPSAGTWNGLQFTANAAPTQFDGTGGYLSGSVLQWVTIEYAGGSPTPGAIELQQIVGIDHSTIRQSATRGLYAPDGLNNLRITNNTFDHNATACCTSGGAIHAWGDNLIITGNTFSNNSTTYEGGAIRVRNNATISGNTFTANSVSSSVGGAVRASGSATVTNNTFTGNWSGVNAGALYVDGSSTITGNTFTSNASASWAGAIWAGGSATINNNTFTSNTSYYGGAIWAETGATLTGNTFTSNSAHWGGALFIERAMTVSRNLFVDNRATSGDAGDRRGAAVFARYGYAVTLQSNTFSKNRVVLSPGETSASAALHIQDGMHPSATGNTFAANAPYDLSDWNGCCGTYDFSGNYWSTTSDAGVVARIYHFFNDASLERVIYRTFATAPDANAPRPAATVLTASAGDGQIGPANTALPQPFVVEARDVSGGPLASLDITFAIVGTPTGAVNQDIDQPASGVQGTFATTTDVNGRAQATFTLGSRPGIYTVTASAPNAASASTALFAATATVSGCTTVGGSMTQNTTWTLDASPYCVSSSVVVSGGITLTVQPGVEVRFATNTRLQVDGALIAQGTSAAPIKFTSSSPSPAAGSWLQILYSNSATPSQLDAQGNYLGGSVLQYATVEYATAALEMHQPVLVDHVAFHQNNGRAITTTDSLNNLRITNSTFDHNSTVCCNSGGAIHAWGDNHIITGNTFSNNSTTYEGGAIRVRSNATISGNTFTANSVSSSIGGAVRASGSATVTNNTFTGNWSGSQGGALYVEGSSTITGNTFTSNSSATWAGAIWAAGGSVTISNNTFTSNSSANGGAIWAEGGSTISGNTFTSNSAHWGGALYVERSITIRRNKFVTNQVTGGDDGDRRGAAVFGRYGYSVTLEENLFAANRVVLSNNEGSSSGAVHVQEGMHPTIRGNTFAANVPYDLTDWNACCGTLDATSNHWGTTGDGGILARIYDFFDDGGLERVVYRPFLPAAAPNAPTAGLPVVATGGDGQTGPAGSTLPQPFVASGLTPNIQVTFDITMAPTGAVNQDIDQSAGGQQSTFSTTADGTGHAQATLTLGSSPGLYVVKISVPSDPATGTVFTATATPSGCTAVGGPIDQSLTLTAAGPYCVTSSFAVATGVSLTLQPGAELRFNPAKALYVDGALVANGTAANPILLTSGSATSARSAGDWRGVYFSSLSSPTDATEAGVYQGGSILRYTTIEFGGQGAWNAVSLNQPVLVDHTTIRQTSGRGLWAADDLNRLHVTDSTFDHNATPCCTSGGAIHAWGDNHVIKGNTFTNNTTTYEGGAIRVRSNATISGNTFTANSDSSSIGGAVRAAGGALVTNNTFTGNWSGNNGGALYTDGSSTITGNTFTSNASANWGGAIWAAGGSSTISNNTFTSNSSANGGAIWAEGGTSIADNGFISNSAHWGGALYVERSVSIVRNLFKTNHAVGGTDTDRRGAAVFSRYNYSVTLRYNTFTANAISLNPGETSTSGALHIQEGSHPTISGNTFGGDNTPYGLSDWNGCCGTEVATGNFWATTVEGQIQGQIYDHLDNGGLETVQYTPWLDAPDPNAVLTINGAESEVTVAPLSALATGADQVTITVTVKDASGVTVPGATVVVNASGSNNTLTAVVDQGNGTYTALLSSTKAEVKVISATANGAPIAQTATATFVAGAPTRYAVTSTLTAPPPGTMVTLYAQLMDANNNNAGEAGHVVTWTTSTGALSAASSTTDASGRAAVQLTTSVAPGVAHTVTALEVANGLTGAITLTNINSVATRYIVTSSSATPPAGSAVTLSAQLADAAGQPAAEAGRIVNWSSTNGGAFLNLTSVTNASGVATMQFTVSTTPSTVHTVTATDGQGLTGSTAVTATGGGNPTITVRDGAGNALVTVYAGSPVRVVGNNFAPGGSGKVQLNGIALGTGCDPAGVFLANFANATSSFDALVTVPLACSGNVTVLAVNGTQVIASASLTVLTPFVSPGRSSMAASRTAAPADGVTTVTMTVTVRDSNNNLLAGRPVSLTYIRGANASANDGIVPPASNSDSGGTAVFTITSSTLGVANFTATADGVHLGQSIAVTFTGPGASITMVAQSLPQMAGSFNFGFTPSGGSTTSFTLDDNPASALANSRGFNDLPLGAYTVRQLPAPAGWLLTNVVCTGATGSSVLVTGASDTAGFQPGDDRALITLVAGDHITCTFTNTRLASITIVADSDPDSPQAFTFTLVKPSGQGDLYVLDDDATTDTHPRQTTVAALSPGAYTLTEAPVPGWSLTATNCPTASMTSVPNGVTLQMAAGQDVTCTFTNSQSPQVTLSLNPAQIVTGVNSTVNVTIHMDSGGQLVDGAQAVLNFDPAILEVVDNGGALATEVALGDCALPTLILNAVDNAHGAINLALGADQTTPTPISGACNLGVVRFHTKAGTTGNGSSIGLALGPAFPASGASFATTNLVVTATGASVVTQDKGLTFVQVPAQVAHSFPFGKAVTVRLMDGDQPNTSDNTTVVTLRIGTGPAAAALTCAGDANVSDPGDEQPGTPGVQKTAVNGLVTFRNCAIDLPGDYTVQATATGAATATTTLHVTWTGDANGDCSVSIIDFSILVTSFNKTTGTAGFVQAADFDGSGKVDILDFSKLVTMFATRCPSLTANAGTPASGGQTEFQLTGSSYKAFATLAITVDGAASAVVATADGTGAWTAAVTVPTGMHVIKASQLNGRVIAGVVVTAPAAP